MDKQQSLCFSTINVKLKSAELFTDAAEMHGILSGFLCGGSDLNSNDWKVLLNDIVNEGQGLPISVKKIIDELYTKLIKQLSSEGLNFNLLLPDDDQSLVDRLEAVAQWSQGFLTGFGLVQQGLSKADSDVQELIKDIRDITQLELEIEDEGEESEKAYVDIVEYLRVAAMLCFDYFRAAPKKTTLH